MSKASSEPRQLVSGAGRRERLRRSRLYLVTDDATPSDDLPGLLASALSGGVDLVQLRRKGVPPDQLVALAATCREVCHAAGALFLVNDHVELAAAAGADGVHLGQDDTPVARTRLGPEFLIGLSTHDPAQLRSAAGLELDYVAAGPVHLTPTKMGSSAVGFEHVEAAARAAAVPVVAIGGLGVSDARAAIAAGADMVAVVRAICASANPEAAARALRSEIDAAPEWSWIRLNGEARKCPPGETVQRLLADLQLDPTALVVERNGVIVDRHSWAEAAVGAGDQLELVHFVGGG